MLGVFLPFILQTKYNIFDKPNYPPNLLFTSPNKNYCSYYYFFIFYIFFFSKIFKINIYIL